MSSSTSSNNSNGDRHAYDHEIPTEQNIEQTQNVIQNQVSGQKRDNKIIITDFPESAAMGRILMNMGFPADKNKILQFVQEKQESEPECRFGLQRDIAIIKKIEERKYGNAFEVTRAAGLVRSLK